MTGSGVRMSFVFCVFIALAFAGFASSSARGEEPCGTSPNKYVNKDGYTCLRATNTCPYTITVQYFEGKNGLASMQIETGKIGEYCAVSDDHRDLDYRGWRKTISSDRFKK